MGIKLQGSLNVSRVIRLMAHCIQLFNCKFSPCTSGGDITVNSPITELSGSIGYIRVHQGRVDCCWSKMCFFCCSGGLISLFISTGPLRLDYRAHSTPGTAHQARTLHVLLLLPHFAKLIFVDTVKLGAVLVRVSLDLNLAGTSGACVGTFALKASLDLRFVPPIVLLVFTTGTELGPEPTDVPLA